MSDHPTSLQEVHNRIRDLSAEDARGLLHDIYDLLWDAPYKQWSPDTLETIGGLMCVMGLEPWFPSVNEDPVVDSIPTHDQERNMPENQQNDPRHKNPKPKKVVLPEKPFTMQDEDLKCRDCGDTFVFTAGEQEFFVKMKFTNRPSRCKECQAAHKAKKDQASRR